MRKRLQHALMASSVIATFLSLTPSMQAQKRAGNIVASTDDEGRKVFVNDSNASSSTPRSTVAQPAPDSGPRTGLVFWSIIEKRWKPVPKANVRAARSAAAEVNSLLGRTTTQPVEGPTVSASRNRPFTQQEVDQAIELAAARHNVDPNLVRSVIKVESNFNPNAVSRKGAMGLMQLMPQTARQLNVTNPFDPEQNVDAGVRHLKRLMESYGGDVRLSLAAYNAGAGRVARSAGIPRIAETRNYVKRITELYYGGAGWSIMGNPVHDPVRMQRDARGVLYISNVE
jgi:soluble lytic murein transglycosylase-like protein